MMSLFFRRYCPHSHHLAALLIPSSSSFSSSRDPQRYHKKRKKAARPDLVAVSDAIASLPARLTPDSLTSALAGTRDTRLLLPILLHSLRLPNFRPGPSPFLHVVKRLAVTRNPAGMDAAASLALSLPSLESPGPLLQSLVYFYCQFNQLGKAFHVYTRMRASRDPAARPTLHTYHTLFSALLSRGGDNTLIHHMYMDPVSALFRQMLEERIAPDTRTLNVLVKGYAQSLHMNDALRVFHQMQPVYGCEPDEFTYSYLVKGLCMQGRTRNAREVFEEMRGKGMVLSLPAGNAFVSALALEADLDAAEKVMSEMAAAGRVVDGIARRTVVEEMGRARGKKEAVRLLMGMEEKGVVDTAERWELLGWLEEELRYDDRRCPEEDEGGCTSGRRGVEKPRSSNRHENKRRNA